ncbi:sensor histidine kinase [Vallitalea okinawensis]|uniref:sensor histidine kinase n=1 Tax=Vallitalea okinawensis TaxID=2078660 RepID=UPI000CFD2A50|nr:histidine kinase [Vallitalea okinawensis]
MYLLRSNNIENMKHRIKSKMVRMRIRTKFLLVFFVVIFFISSMVLLAATYISDQIFTKYSIELSEELVEQISINIHNRANEIEDLTYLITQNIQIKELLYLCEEGIETYEKSILQSKMNSLLNSSVYNSGYINKIIISTTNGDYFWWEKQSGETINDGLTEVEVQMYMRKIVGNGLPTDNSALWMESPMFEDEVFLLRPIIDENNINNNLGIILFSFKSSYLSGVNTEGIVLDSDKIAIIDNESDQFFETDLVNRRLYLKLIESGEYKKDKLNQMFIKVDGEDYLLTEAYIEKYDWKIMTIISQEQQNNGKASLQLFIFIVAIISIIITVIIAFYISGNITKNISLLEKNITKVEEGDFNVRIKPVSYDEIGLIGLRFNYMVNEIQSLINRLYISEVEKQKIEHEVLKAQINPHFLYNTLGSIKWMAISKGQDDIGELVTSLIELLKASIKQKSTYQILSEEIEYIKYYISIIQSSLDGVIQMNNNIEEGIENYYVLNFMLQPIVENAIFHGLELRKGNARIDLSAYTEENKLVIKISDNGRGMSEEKIREILSSQSDHKYSGLNSIGVKNVNERLKLYFGKTYGLKYSSIKGEGTTVKFTLPIMTMPKED